MSNSNGSGSGSGSGGRSSPVIADFKSVEDDDDISTIADEIAAVGVDGGEEGSPKASKGVLAKLISMLKQFSVGSELSTISLQIPEGFESRNSSLEAVQTNFMRHSDLLIKINNIEDPVLRMLQIVQYMFTLGAMFKNKKPLNPVLGEVSLCKFYSNQKRGASKNTGEFQKDDDKNVFYCVSEQVSHHPPISTFAAVNKEQGVRMNSHTTAHVKFLGTSVKLAFDGVTTISFDKFKEDYSFGPVPVMIRLIGLNLEYCGKVDITCKGQPYKTKVNFIEKPMMRGKYHKVKGEIVKIGPGDSEEPVMTFKGHWDKDIKVEDLRSKTTSLMTNEGCPRAGGIPVHPLYRDELAESSRKVWHNLKVAVDSSAAAKAKREVEEEQRRRVKERTASGEEWVPKYFDFVKGGAEMEGWYVKEGTFELLAF